MIKLLKTVIRASILSVVIVMFLLLGHSLVNDVPIPMEDTGTLTVMFLSALCGILVVALQK